MARESLTVVTPCFNEELALPQFHARISEIFDELAPDVEARVVFVDDGSRDGTFEVLRAMEKEDPRVSFISLSRNRGHQIALFAGLDQVKTDALVFMDSDLQHPPELIPDMVRKWRSGVDVVQTIRESTADSSAFKRWSSGWFYWIARRLCQVDLQPNAADFCLLDRKAYSALRSMRETHLFLRAMIPLVGFRRDYISFKADARVAGHSKYSLKKMLCLASDGVMSFTAAPLRVSGLLGLTLAALGGAYLAYILFAALFLGNLVQGWASVLSVSLILGGAQLVSVGLLGEYLSKVFEQTKERPLYFLKKELHEREEFEIPMDDESETADLGGIAR